MKLKSLILTACIALTPLAAVRAGVEITLSAGILLEHNGSTLMPDGGLLQIIVSNDATFVAPTASSFTGGDSNEEVLLSVAMDSSTSGEGGALSEPLTYSVSADPAGGTFVPVANQQILLRWWPLLTLSSTSPGAGATYGQFRTDTEPDASTGTWVILAEGGSADLNFLTNSSGAGTQPNSAGIANNTVAAAPEPSSLGLAAMGLVGGLAALRRRKAAR